MLQAVKKTCRAKEKLRWNIDNIQRLCTIVNPWLMGFTVGFKAVNFCIR
jgi:hypothetical protein